MKALPPAPSQLLPLRSDLVPFVVEPSARKEILRALAEILLLAADALEEKGQVDEPR